MTIFESISLVLAILVIGTAIAYYLQKDQPPMKDFIALNEEVEATVEKTQQVTKEAQTQVEAIQEVESPLKAAPQGGTVNPEALQVPKKKRKYYAKKPKTQI